MISERPSESSELPASRVLQTSANAPDTKAVIKSETPGDAESHEAIVVVRGETVRDQNAPKGSAAKDNKNDK